LTYQRVSDFRLFVRKTTTYKEAAMSNQIKAIVKTHNRDIARRKEIKLRKHLNADALFATMKTGFDKIGDHRPGNVQHSLGDALMSGFAMFSLKDPSLLAFGVFAYLMSEGLKRRIIS